ncbi:MAG: hypothetical protein RBS36_04155 [Thiomicrospira sp.]|jgi:hypothetical protein|nr:hypothetical protein [Thiomicrospira sp.]
METITLNNQAWSLVSAVDCTYQVISSEPAYMSISATEPSQSQGFVVVPLVPNYFAALNGRSLWMRAVRDSASVYMEHSA